MNFRFAEFGQTQTTTQDAVGNVIKLMAYNLKSCRRQQTCLDEVADLIRHEEPDAVLLTQVLFRCDSCETSNQVEYLARTSGLPTYAFGENYRRGWPLTHDRSGNAILSRFALNNVRLQSMGKVRLKPRQTRRVVWAEMNIAGETMLIGALHNSSLSVERNVWQAEQILRFSKGPMIIGGDFNARPDSKSIGLLLASGRLSGDVSGPPTYPSDAPVQRIDYIFAPSDWALVEHRVIEHSASDHLPIISTFALSTRQELRSIATESL